MTEIPAKAGAPVRLFVNEIAAFGGVERLILALSRYLHGRAIAHEIGCFHDTIGLQNHADWPVRVVALAPPRNILSEARAFRTFLTGSAPKSHPLVFDQKGAFYVGVTGLRDLHIHFTDQPSLLSRDISKWAWSAPRVPSQATPGALVRARGEIVHRLNQRGAQRAASLIVMTERARAELQTLYDVRAAVIRPGISRDMGQADRPEQLRRSLLSVCRLENGKRVEWIIRAFGRLAQDFPDWTLTIVGDGAYRSTLEKLARSQGAGARVNFRGRVSDAELDEAYAQAGAFAMPAVQGYGLPALEALERGVPVVLHEGSAVCEILGGTPWAEIVTGDEAAFETGLRRLLKRVEQGALLPPDRPHVPSDLDWAAAVARHCGWVD